MPTQTDSELYSNGKKVDPKTLEFFRALQDPKKGYEICKKIFSDSTARINKDAAVMRKFNDEQPWPQNELNAAGQGWRNNRATGFLPNLVRRAIHPYKQTVDTVKYLTNSTLPEEVENWNEKSENYQLEFTRVLRGWSEWNNLTYIGITEDILFGHAQAVYTDTIDWRPRFARSDDCVFPDGAPQNAKDIPLMVLNQSFQIHQLAKYLRNPDVATAAGWKIDAVVTAINDAAPENRQKGDAENTRKVEDTVRETTMGRSYSEGVDVVLTYHLFIQEATGKVSHYLYNKKNGDILFMWEDQFNGMDECLRLFTLEVGNGTVYGSKGAGRTLYNTHVAIEQARNLIADALYLSGLLILKTTTPNKKKIALTVTHPFCVVGEGYEIIEHSFQVNSDAFFQLDRHMSSIAEMQVGVFMPGMQLEGKTSDAVSASQINYMASVETQIKEGVLSRFKGQFSALTTEIQRRMFSEDNIKKGIELFKLRKATGLKLVSTKVINFMKSISTFLGIAPSFKAPQIPEQRPDDPSVIAAEAVANLLERGLSAVEIFVLANTPSDKFTDDPMTTNPGGLDIIAQRYGADPSVDKEELKKIDISQKIGQKLADRLVIPGLDQTIVQEAQRMQILENVVLASGEDVPVSSRDNDKVHLDVLMQTAGKVLNTMNEASITKFSIDVMGKFVAHMQSHVQAALSKGTDKDSIKPEIEFVETANKMLAGLQGKLPQTPQGGGAALPPGARPAIGSEEEADLSAPPRETQSGVPVSAIGTAQVSALNKPLSRAITKESGLT